MTIDQAPNLDQSSRAEVLGRPGQNDVRPAPLFGLLCRGAVNILVSFTGSLSFCRLGRWASGFDEFQAVAVLVADGKHRWDSWLAHHLAHLDSVGLELSMGGVGVGGSKPDTRRDAGRNAGVGTDKSEGGPSRSPWPHVPTEV